MIPTPRHRLLGLLVPCVLTACAGVPHRPAPALQVKAPEPVVADVDVTPKMLRPAQPADFWSGMRDSFALPGCSADPAVMEWAHTYTRSPARFEQQVNEVLPLIVYAHKSAVQHSVAGEFALLPWVESQYRHVPGGKNMPAGMWQIMPQTARTLGLRVEKNYDQRLDITASTEAVMTMMRRYYDDLGDWRLVDIAYNAGEFGLKNKLDAHGTPPADPAIPRMPMKKVTREHLVKLMAIACVVRDPAKFNVSLPAQSSDDALQVVQVNNPQSLATAARRSGLSMNDLRGFNPAYRTTSGTIASSMLLPRSAAEQYRQADTSGDDTPDEVVADKPAAEAAETKAAKKIVASKSGNNDKAPATHRVGSGESLWTIARRHSVSVKQLMQWNDLHSQNVKPGQVLRLAAAR
ncbi:membrane-bound lytic murein transglycosylase D [Luteibacter rhizovicinus]|uniref:Membrane-bound lytic murein transglycosylase D n=1 Tax=Luteibacter rhizovicinus TaxID=242606 RepID=A0A4R3YXC2_9GAMM|nr:transglycosylase SLT domain-containing protein [Luteibacter rhizovicinus]TCV97361.1 membrane-bound lytic murein transglycosylase D [Luteibacter rhizovicinus]